MAPVTVRPGPSSSFADKRARPKSRIFSRPSSVRKRFSGLRSRCTMPRACAAARPRASWSASPCTWEGGSRGPSITVRKVCPSSSSVTRNGTPSCSPRSYTASTFGCSSAPAVCASCSKRRTRAGSWAAVTTLTATRRPSLSSRATSTRPIPPFPSSRSLQSLHLVRDDLVLDLRVRRLGDDLLLHQLVLRLVGPALDDLLRVGVADPGQRLQLLLAGGVQVELLGLLRRGFLVRGLRLGECDGRGE